MSHTTLNVKLDDRLYDRLLELAKNRGQKPTTLAAQAVIDYLRTQDALAATLLENQADLERWDTESPTEASTTAPVGHHWPG